MQRTNRVLLAAVMGGFFACTGFLQAEIRPVELTIVRGPGAGLQSQTQLDLSVKFAVLGPIGGSDEEIPTLPQKASGEISGRPSDRSPLEGTVSLLWDSTNNKIQVAGGDVSFSDTGNYCPGDADTEECPIEEVAELGYYVGALPGAGDGAAGAIRNTELSFRGVSAIGGGNSISVLNWHAIVLGGEAAIDGYGPALDSQVGYQNASLEGLEENQVHFESESGEVNEATFFNGTFVVSGSDATLTLPVYVPFWVYDPPSEPDPDEYFRLLLRSISEVTQQNDTISATGTLGAALTPGDANRDGKVDGLDVNIVSRFWGKGVGATDPSAHTANQRELHTVEHLKYSVWDEGDFDLDAATSTSDLALLVANFGAGAGGGSGGSVGQVPEPSSVVLAGLAGLVMFLARRRHSGG